MARGPKEITVIIRKKQYHEHDKPAGTWKIAYADFVTAMMAFFLLLWLLNAATESGTAGLSFYFAPKNISEQVSGQGKPGEGISTDSTNPNMVTLSLPAITVLRPTFGEETRGRKKGQIRKDETEKKIGARDTSNIEIEDPVQAQAKDKILQSIKELVMENNLQEYIVIEESEDRDHIELLDSINKPLFEKNSAKLTNYGKRLLYLMGTILQDSNLSVSITGHTSLSNNQYSQEESHWKISSERALNSINELISAGLKLENIIEVKGSSNKDLYDPNEPYSIINDRIVIKIKETPEGFDIFDDYFKKSEGVISSPDKTSLIE